MNFLDASRNPQINSCQRRLICRLLVERDLSGLARRDCDAVGDHEGPFHCLENEAPDRGGTFVSPAAAAGPNFTGPAPGYQWLPCSEIAGRLCPADQAGHRPKGFIDALRLVRKS